MLMYGTYVRAKLQSTNKSISEIVKDELRHFPYKTKNKFQVTPSDMRLTYEYKLLSTSISTGTKL
jgi:hypothetical protein